MTFTVANIIASFNSKSGGPGRTVSTIAAAGVGHWQADLITTDYLESASDRSLIPEFPGTVELMPARYRSTWVGMSMLVGRNRTVEACWRHGTPDIMHIHGLWTPYLAAFAQEARRCGVPYIVSPHGMLEPWCLSMRSLRKSIALKTYQGRLLAAAAALHATSSLEADNLRRLTGNRTPIYVVPNAVETPLASYGAHRKDPGNPKRVMLFLSRIHEKKGLDLLLQAWHDLRPSAWRLLIVGSGEEAYVSRLKNFCASHDMPDVEFRSHVEGEARERVFEESSVFVLPTFSENFGNVVGEALIRGLPVITTTGTPWSDLTVHDCGWYIEPTLDDLKRTIGQVVATHADDLAAMGRRGRDFASANFSLATVRGPLLEMYRAAIRCGGRQAASLPS